MWKKIISSFIAISLSLFCFSQQSAEHSIRKYAANDTANSGHTFYILEITPSAAGAIKDKLTLSALRKFSETVFIIEKKILGNIASDKAFIKKIIPANNNWKLSPSAETIALHASEWRKAHHFTILLKSNIFLEDLLTKLPALRQKVSTLPEQNIISILTGFDQIQKLFLNDDRVLFIDVLLSKPTEELGTPGFDLSANTINSVHSQYPLINGRGQHVSIKEDYYDTTDIDLKGRYDIAPLASKNISNHANFIATIIAGAGNSTWYSKGAAWDAGVSSSSFDEVLPDADSSYVQQNISVQNHSYGTVVENDYGLNAVAFDESAHNNEGLLHVFSSGNLGNATSGSGVYSGIAGFANLTGNFKMAKNILTVGAVDSFGNAALLSSKGPAYDGRIKPELVAFQKNGTSEAAALVSGTALLLQQYYKTQHSDSVLPSALAKAILITAADDVYNPGPDYTTGFGNLNAIQSMELVKNGSIFKGIISQGASQSFSIDVPSNTGLLKVTLVWNDTTASPLIPKALVNDLDLEVALPATGASWKPWVLSPVANTDSLNSPAVRKRDSLNNVEEVTIENPLPGEYRVNINGYHVPAGPQKYYIAHREDTLNVFKWERLTNVDFAQGGRQNILRWYPVTGRGNIDYSYASSANWLPVAADVDLSKNYFYWSAPDTTARAILRMKTGNAYFYSDTFFITTLLNPEVGFICNDSILVHWKKIRGVDQYQVYSLGEKYMEPMLKVIDTSALISKNMLTDKFIAVAPVMPAGPPAPKSYAFDYTLQGAGCFINAFLADATGDDARLTLNMGTLYQVDSISFEKQTATGFVHIFSPALTNQLTYVYDYRSLTRGITYFRAKINLTNSRVIYAPVQAAFYVEPGKYLLLPVPVTGNNDISLYTTLPGGEIISVFDAVGRIVLQKEIAFTRETIQTSLLRRGEYFYRISKNGVKVYSGKFIIL